jgi:hypothetical protein
MRGQLTGRKCLSCTARTLFVNTVHKLNKCGGFRAKIGMAMSGFYLMRETAKFYGWKMVFQSIYIKFKEEMKNARASQKTPVSKM